MEVVTRKQMNALKELFYWTGELQCALDSADQTPEYISFCACNAGYSEAKCDTEGISIHAIQLAKVEGSNWRVTMGENFELIAKQNDVYVEGSQPQQAAKHTVIAMNGKDALLMRNSDGIYIFAHGYDKEADSWDWGTYYDNDFQSFVRAAQKIGGGYSRAEKVAMMHQVMLSMNNEDAYYEWIYTMPDEPTEEDFEYYAENAYGEIIEEFCHILLKYSGPGLYNADMEVWDFAKKFVPTISNYVTMRREENEQA